MSIEVLAVAPVNYHDTCHHRKVYNLSCEQMDDLLEYAGRACQICRLPERDCKRGRLVIDHLGEYGFHLVRGLLCDKCNMLMRRVDAREQMAPPSAVYEYKYNSWFSRQLDPRGPSVRYRVPHLGKS